jgi:hypothetical protein
MCCWVWMNKTILTSRYRCGSRRQRIWHCKRNSLSRLTNVVFNGEFLARSIAKLSFSNNTYSEISGCKLWLYIKHNIWFQIYIFAIVNSTHILKFHLDQPIELTRARTWPHVPDQANAPAPARTSRWPRIDQPTAPTLHVPACPRPSQRMTQPFYYRASVIPRATTLSHFLCYSAQPFLVLQCSSFFDCYSAQLFLTATMLNYFFYCYNA